MTTKAPGDGCPAYEHDKAYIERGGEKTVTRKIAGGNKQKQRQEREGLFIAAWFTEGRQAGAPPVNQVKEKGSASAARE